MRFLPVVLAGCFWAGSLAAQPALVQSDIARAATCLGNAEVASAPVEPARDIVIAVFSETLRDEEMAQLRKEIATLYQSTRQTNSIRLALLAGNNVQFAGPFKTRALLQSALAEIMPAAPDAAAPPAVPPARFYNVLGTVAAQLGMDWSTVVLAGQFPPVPPEQTAYTAGWLSMQLRAAKLRTSYWTPGGTASDLLDSVTLSTGGVHLADGLEPLAAMLKQKAEFREVSWPAPAPAWSFRACPVSLAGADNQPVVQVPSVAAAAGVTIPDPERYALMRDKIQSLSAALQQPQLTAEQAGQAEADFSAALEVSPREEETLRLGMKLYQLQKNDIKLGSVLAALTEIAPNQAGLFTELGHLRYRLGDWDGADRALLRARELKPGDPAVSEELARIRLTRKDDRAALPFLEETLAARANSQELWLLRADVATRLNDWQRIADSMEHAVALGSVPLERRTSLVRLYLAHQEPDRALVHVRAVASNLPADAAVRTEYARFFDTLHQPDEALAAWKQALAVDAKLEPAHERITRLLIDKGTLPDALQAAEAGIEAAPQAAPLYLAKAEILEKQNLFYAARRTLRDAAPNLPDPALLTRLAEMEDAGGRNAAKDYRAVAEAAEKGGAPPPNQAEVLDRGLAAALRDGDLEDAAWFRMRLPAASGANSTARAHGGTVPIPGGKAALSFTARSRQSSAERFLVEYARTVVRRLSAPDKKAVQTYTESIHEHFRRISELLALGTPKGSTVTVMINAQDKKNQKNAEKILDLLGWKMHTVKQGVKLEPAEKGSRASHQETASALAINEVGMQEDLEAGKPFSFEIPVETANVVLGEEAWKSQFYAKEKYPGGLAEVLATDLHLAQTYAALGQMEAGTAEVLASSVGLKTLVDKYAALLLQYSSALAIENGRVAVPGGIIAEAIWTGLAGASPRQPAAFFRALLAKDDGKLLAYYADLAALDIQHQRFFTRSPARTAKFYQLFKDAPEMQRANSRHIPSGSFAEFLSEVPLDQDGSVDFPGSPEVWTVAKGQSRSTGNMAKMIKKLKRAAAPDVEDEILLRLAGTRYKQGAVQRGELDNFLAVVRIDEHRSDPLDEDSALGLAQHFAEDGAAYPFFATLTGLGQKQFEQFFALTETLRGLSEETRELQLAPIYALLEIVCLAKEAGALDEAQSTEWFGRIVDGFQHATTPAARTTTALDLVRGMLGKAGAADPDQALRTLLLGSYGATTVDLDGTPVTVDPSKSRHARYQQVLDSQKVPSLATVLALADAARGLAAGKGDAAAQIRVLDLQAAGLNFVEAPKELGLKGKEREQVEGFQPKRLQDLVKQFREKTARKKVNPKDLEKLAQDYLEEMDAPVRWALEGVIYAYFLNPDDLLVSEDPLLLRKHKFLIVVPGHKSGVWQGADLEQSSQNAGSYFTGGFADFGDAAGAAAAKSAKLGGDVGESAAAKQIGALRLTDWGELRNDDLRLMGLKVTVAREWVVQAARRPELEAALAESALGLLSLTRRADLLTALAEGNWASVWNLLTLSDLYFLADRYLDRYSMDPWQSPATRALRQLQARDDGSRLQWLGGEFDDTLGCSHPHLRPAPPYENYENDLFPVRLAERSAEFKLYLARYADAAGIPAAALGAVAEPAARAILKKMELSDMHDWRSVLAAYGSLNNQLVEEVLAKK